jgi:hypothetical protein
VVAVSQREQEHGAAFRAASVTGVVQQLFARTH